MIGSSHSSIYGTSDLIAWPHTSTSCKQRRNQMSPKNDYTTESSERELVLTRVFDVTITRINSCDGDVCRTRRQDETHHVVGPQSVPELEHKTFLDGHKSIQHGFTRTLHQL